MSFIIRSAQCLRAEQLRLACVEAAFAHGWQSRTFTSAAAGGDAPRTFSTVRTRLRTFLFCRRAAAGPSPSNFHAESAPLQAATTGPVSEPIYAAVVLERLPVVRSPAPEWEADYMAWSEQRKLQRGFYKEYPTQVSSVRGSQSLARHNIRVCRARRYQEGACSHVSTHMNAGGAGVASRPRSRSFHSWPPQGKKSSRKDDDAVRGPALMAAA
jgi:hypothetical protein